MAEESGPLDALAALLRGRGAQPVFSAVRLAPSAVYDLHYRLVVVACAYEIHAKKDVTGARRIKPAKLKLLQFVAIRPWLLPVVREWSDGPSETQTSLLVSHGLRRGFLGDTVHEAIIEFSVACGMLVRVGSHLVPGARVGYLIALSVAANREGWFETERQVLDEIKAISITNNMLEGW